MSANRFRAYRQGWLDAASGRDADAKRISTDADYEEGWIDGSVARNEALEGAMKRFHVTELQIKLAK
jgi:hypothetical protein